MSSRALQISGAIFILAFFIFFSYSGLSAYFTFDDGTTVIACLRLLDTSFWRDLLHILIVFTAAFRPLTAMFWRPLYAVFGFNPLPYRIAVHVLLMLNIGLAYWLARRLEATREAAALTTLIFCYNASTSALYYDTCLIGDILCFLLYSLAVGFYAGGRHGGTTLSWRRTAAVAACYLLALDAKEMAVTLPGVLVIYEGLYRRQDLRDKQKALRVAGLPAAMFVAGAIYLVVKVADMSQNPAYHPHVTLVFILKNLGFYLQQLLYFPENSVTALMGCLIAGGLIAAAALVRSRPAVFGMLFFVTALVPVAVIASRSGYAAYIPYFGLALALGSMLAAVRTHLTTYLATYLKGRQNAETATAVLMFAGVAVLLGWAHLARRQSANGYFEWDKPKLIALMDDFRRDVPEFPPNARVLLTDDVWGPDWGPMFLLRLMYHDNTIWVDRPGNMNHPPDPSSYDLLVNYKAPDIEFVPVRFRHRPMKWEVRGKASGTGMFDISSPNARGSASHVEIYPQTARANQSIRVTIPGLSGVPVNAVYRLVSERESTAHVVKNWCTLDASGSCTVTAPSEGAPGNMIVDWIQPVNQRWILTRGILSITQ